MVCKTFDYLALTYVEASFTFVSLSPFELSSNRGKKQQNTAVRVLQLTLPFKAILKNFGE
jgi:hypothetical protein